MSVGFGFSVGDFIAAVELVANVVDALRESGEASKRYRELARQLDSLESALVRVKRLEVDEEQHAEYIALQQAAAQCQRTIEGFWKKIKKYQPALGSQETSRLKESWMKIRWAVCKKEDVNTFKGDVAAHTESIQLLLTTMQMSRVNLLEKKNDRRVLSLAGQIQAGYFQVMKKISAVFEATSTGIEQGKQLISTTSRILQMNVQIFQTVLKLQNFITQIPAQVERQQPVYLVDALGRQSPFHLEFIRSAEALTAVLQANFSKTGQARKKIGRGEFVIQDSRQKRDINIFDDWDKCFYPGQRVEMSVLFQRRWQAGSTCPGCGLICNGSTEADVKCPDCDMTFRRIIKIEDDGFPMADGHQKVQKDPSYNKGPLAIPNPTQLLFITETPTEVFPIYEPEELNKPMTRSRKRKREYSSDDKLELDLHLENIRRVRIQTVSRGVTDKFEVMFGYFEEGGKPEPAFCCGFRTRDDESCLIIEFEDSRSNALCDTIDRQAFKLGGLFHTELVAAELVDEATEESDKQITWMEEDEVQMYLRFKSDKDRKTLWSFILAARFRRASRYSEPPLSHPDQQFGGNTNTSFENSGGAALQSLPELGNLAETMRSMNQYGDQSPLLDLSPYEANANLPQEPIGHGNNDLWTPYSQEEVLPKHGTVQDETNVQRYSQFEEFSFDSFANFDNLNGFPGPQDQFPSSHQDFNQWFPLFPDGTMETNTSNTSQNPPPASGKHSSVSGVSSRKREKPLPPIILDNPNTLIESRTRNTLAARKSRQRKEARFESFEYRLAELEAGRVQQRRAEDRSRPIEGLADLEDIRDAEKYDTTGEEPQRKSQRFNEVEKKFAMLEAEHDQERALPGSRQQIEMESEFTGQTVTLMSATDVGMDRQQNFGEMDAFDTD